MNNTAIPNSPRIIMVCVTFSVISTLGTIKSIDSMKIIICKQPSSFFFFFSISVWYRNFLQNSFESRTIVCSFAVKNVMTLLVLIQFPVERCWISRNSVCRKCYHYGNLRLFFWRLSQSFIHFQRFFCVSNLTWPYGFLENVFFLSQAERDDNRSWMEV